MCWIIGKGHEKHYCADCEHQLSGGDNSPCHFCMIIATGHCQWQEKKAPPKVPGGIPSTFKY